MSYLFFYYLNFYSFIELYDVIQPLRNDSLRTKGGNSLQGEQENLQVHKKPNSEETTGTIFKTPFMRNMTIFLCYNWFVCTCSYYGLTLSSTRLNESPYISFFLQALVEVPANFGAIPLMSRSVV